MYCLFYKPKDGLLNSEKFPIFVENGNMKLYVQKQFRFQWNWQRFSSLGKRATSTSDLSVCLLFTLLISFQRNPGLV